PAMEGRRREALEIVRAALPAIRKRGIGFVAAVLGMALLTVLPSEPDVRELAREGLVTFERMGARPFAELNSKLLSREGASEPANPSSSSGRLAGGSLDHTTAAAQPA